MVSKIAVMALVAVVAVPILLGYGLNINTEDRQVWTDNNDPLNAKDYLQTTFDATGITFTDADIYKMNSNIFHRGPSEPGFYPKYVAGTSVASAIKMAGGPVYSSFDLIGSNGYSQVLVDGGYDASNYYSIKLWHNSSNWGEYDHIKLVIYNTDGSVYIQYDYSYGGYRSTTVTEVTAINFIAHGTPSGYANYDYSGAPYINLSKGYRLNMDGEVWNPSDLFPMPLSALITHAKVSNTTKSMLISMDLNSITDSDAMFRMDDGQGYVWFKKTTTGGVVKWEYTSKTLGQSGTPLDFQEIYYNPLASSNTYQVYLNADLTGELRYIGAWSDTIGAATSLLTYQFEIDDGSILPPREFIYDFSIKGQSPIMRIDAARIGAYDYMVMEDAVYDPAAFRANPITTLTNGLRFGQSLEFGGNTYQVTKGNITIGTHDFSLEGMTFESVQVGGQYENRINGNTVSTTAEPSTITFNGKWLTDVTTESQAMTTVSDTKWEPGKFAWDGIDTDFKIAGLMASLGAFIGLAVYGRRSGAKVMPLLVVCGGAALMFLVMI